MYEKEVRRQLGDTNKNEATQPFPWDEIRQSFRLTL